MWTNVAKISHFNYNTLILQHFHRFFYSLFNKLESFKNVEFRKQLIFDFFMMQNLHENSHKFAYLSKEKQMKYRDKMKHINLFSTANITFIHSFSLHPNWCANSRWDFFFFLRSFFCAVHKSRKQITNFFTCLSAKNCNELMMKIDFLHRPHTKHTSSSVRPRFTLFL